MKCEFIPPLREERKLYDARRSELLCLSPLIAIGYPYCFANSILFFSLLCAHLAYESKRAYVFQEYHWAREHYPFPFEPTPTEWAPRTPLNALISGPIAGGPWDDGDPAPRSVSEDYFELVCPPEDRDIINTREVKPA